MFTQLLSLFALTFFFIISLLLAVYWMSNLIANFLGSPFVPTKARDIEQILKVANLKKGQVFMELGSGDGRVVIAAAQKYSVFGIGIEVNPLLFGWAIFSSRLSRVKNVSFVIKNFFDVNMGDADTIFLFLMPETLDKLKNKFLSECKNNAQIISHGFRISGWDKNLEKKIKSKPFPTYFYRLMIGFDKLG